MAKYTIEIECKITFFGKYLLPLSKYKLFNQLIILLGKKYAIAKIYTSKNKIDSVYLKNII